MKTIHFAVIGADKRLFAAAEALRMRGADVSFFGEEHFSLARADAVLLPLPMSRDGIFVSNTDGKLAVADVLDAIGEHTPVFAGMTDAFSDARLVDYTKEDLFAILNAVPTAEGALAIVLSETEITVRGMHVGVTGFGKVARAVAALFYAAGAHVTVFARRKEALAEAEALGYIPCPVTALSARAGELDTLINTVPEQIVDHAVLAHVDAGTLVLDLASMPGGVDFAFAKEKGIRAIHALALPGKYSPKTAGETIARTVLARMEAIINNIDIM